jgi:hypothetical protein
VTRTISPAVLAEAARLGLDQNTVAAIKGTGIGNRVSLADVRAAAPFRTQPRAALTGPSRPAPVLRPMSDPWGDHGPVVAIDVFDLNPLVSYVLKTAGPPPSGATPPDFFVSGPIPPLTASGVDPALLVRIPWKLRHTAAMAEEPSTILGILEEIGGGFDITDDDPTLSLAGVRAFDDYKNRVRDWAVSAAPTPELTDSELSFLFGTEGVWNEREPNQDRQSPAS